MRYSKRCEDLDRTRTLPELIDRQAHIGFIPVPRDLDEENVLPGLPDLGA
jgi:hypothetical protein